MLWNDEGPHLKGVEDIDVHVYSDDGSQVECRAKHDIPDQIRRQGVRMAIKWAAEHCPKIGAALDADRRRN